MNGLKLAAFLVVCCAAGAGGTLLYQHLRAQPRATTSAARTGFGNPPPLHGFLLPAGAPVELLANLPPLKATAVTVEYSGDASKLGAFVKAAHGQHLQVVLLPPGGERQSLAGGFSEKDPYPEPLSAVSASAQGAGVDILCVAWTNTDPEPGYWQGQVAEVRKAFKGRVLFAVTPDILPGLEVWESMDLVGAIGPFDLPLRKAKAGRPLDLRDYRGAWASNLDSLESLSIRNGKPLMLLDAQAGVTPDSEREALKFEALLTETKGRTAMEGLFLPWDPTGDARTPSADPLAVNHYPELLAKMPTLWEASAAEKPAKTGDEGEDAETNP